MSAGGGERVLVRGAETHREEEAEAPRAAPIGCGAVGRSGDQACIMILVKMADQQRRGLCD